MKLTKAGIDNREATGPGRGRSPLPRSAPVVAVAQLVSALSHDSLDGSQEVVDEVALPLRVLGQQIVQVGPQLTEDDAAVLPGLRRRLDHDPATVVLIVRAPGVTGAFEPVQDSCDGS